LLHLGWLRQTAVTDVPIEDQNKSDKMSGIAQSENNRGYKVVASGKLALPISAAYKPLQIKQAIEHAQRGSRVLLDFNR
jgi:hypothetical protein